jgi:hypothetical protein
MWNTKSTAPEPPTADSQAFFQEKFALRIQKLKSWLHSEKFQLCQRQLDVGRFDALNRTFGRITTQHNKTFQIIQEGLCGSLQLAR